MDGSETQISYQNDSQTTTSTMGTIDAQRPLYTVPGILHYLQHEWTRFDLERQQWDTERAELQVNKFSFDNVSFIVNFLGTYCFSSR